MSEVSSPKGTNSTLGTLYAREFNQTQGSPHARHAARPDKPQPLMTARERTAGTHSQTARLSRPYGAGNREWGMGNGERGSKSLAHLPFYAIPSPEWLALAAALGVGQPRAGKTGWGRGRAGAREKGGTTLFIAKRSEGPAVCSQVPTPFHFSWANPTDCWAG